MTVFRVGGIPVRLHATLLLVAAWLAVIGARGGAVAFREVAVPLLVVYGSVLVHELGHALVARRLDVPTRAITLHALGGSAQLETRRVSSHVDLLVSLAGPAVNLVIAVPALLLGWALDAEVLTSIGGINLVLGALNLAPAFPLDGGRVLRALLVPSLGLEVANRLALGVGLLGAIGLGVAGVVLRQPVLVPLALFMALLQRREHRIQAILRAHPEWA